MPGVLRLGIPILAVGAFASTEALAQTSPPPDGVTGGEANVAAAPPEGLPLYMPVPEDNPLTPQKVALGRRLFFDPSLSSDRTVSCASCHRPDRAFADITSFSRGADGQRPTRNTPSLLNAGYARPFFWDGRTETLEEQVVQPIANPREMGLPLPETVDRLHADASYRRAFEEAFGDGGIDSMRVAAALASFVRTLRSGGSPADRFAAGDANALSVEAREGYRLFVGKAGCAACHGGPLFTDERLHNTGVSWGSEDIGAAEVTGRPEDRGRFNTPSLRNVALTPPYMHDGSLGTLRDVVGLYDLGGGANPNLDRRLNPLRLTPEEIDALVAYLNALTSGARRRP